MTDRYIVKTVWFSKRPLGGQTKHITFVERDEADMNWQDTIADIRDGQITDVVQVIKFNEQEHTCEDVTRDVAQAIIDGCANGDEYPTGGVFDFCEQALGCRTMAELAREKEIA